MDVQWYVDLVQLLSGIYWRLHLLFYDYCTVYIQLVLLPTVPIKLQIYTNCIGLTSTISRRDCMEFTQMFHSSDLGLTNKSPPKEELLSAPRMSSQSKHCNQKYILFVFQHLSCISDDQFIWNRHLEPVVRWGDSWNAFRNVRYCYVLPDNKTNGVLKISIIVFFQIARKLPWLHVPTKCTLICLYML